MRRTSGHVIIAGKPFYIEAPVINFTQPPYWNATAEYCLPTEQYRNPPCKPGGVPYGDLPRPYTKRYSLRGPLRRMGMNPTLEAVKAVVRQFVIHHDGCSSADMCFNVLQNERGLSCHFLIDNDGTIYQTIDLGLMAYHAGEWNTSSIGVEICNKGDASQTPHFYDSGKYGPKRDVVACKVNGHTILAYDFTQAQKESMTRLARGMQKLLPNLPTEYPQIAPGQLARETLPPATTFRFSGYMAHYHLIKEKWDPGPFDFSKFIKDLRGALSIPIYLKDPDPQLAPPAIPSKTSELKDVTDELYKANEQRADGGFFPVGPWGEARLWHGGVHLSAREGDPVFAPFPGRIVAARMGPSTPIGSTNFVLMRHDMSLGSAKVQFYSLYMHLADETKADKAAEWIGKSELWKNRTPGEVTLLDDPIDAGGILGHVGKAGPGDLSKAQVHVEMFSTYELFTEQPWQTIDGTSGGRFCDNAQINDIIDSDRDGMLSKQELSTFYSGGGAAQTHYLVTLHVSEWTAEPSWADALRVPKDFKNLKPAEIDQLVSEQITPGLWWDARVAAWCRLPADGVVYHYHPVAFLYWFNQQLLDAAASAGPSARVEDASGVPAGVTDDYGDVDGDSMRSAADVADDPCNQKLTLQDLVKGYDAPECGP